MRGDDLYIAPPVWLRALVRGYARGDAELEAVIFAALASVAGEGSVRSAALANGWKTRVVQYHVRRVKEIAGTLEELVMTGSNAESAERTEKTRRVRKGF